MPLSQGILPHQTSPARVPVVLCIAGFDPCGGAGLLADARAAAAFGAYALGVQTALVPQNTIGVRSVVATPPTLLRQQLEVLGEDIRFDAVKIGLLPNVASIEIVGEFLRLYPALPVVVDPVLAPTAGAGWGDDATVAALMRQLGPLATMLTPNLPEAQILSGRSVTNIEQMEVVARQLRARSGAQGVLIKSGHLRSDDAQITDIYADERGVHRLSAPRVEGVGVRGTGCLLASAIAAQLAGGAEPLEAARAAKAWMTIGWRDAQVIGQGRRVAGFGASP